MPSCLPSLPAAVKAPKSKGLADRITDISFQAFQVTGMLAATSNTPPGPSAARSLLIAWCVQRLYNMQATAQQFVSFGGLAAAGKSTFSTATISDATDFMRCCTFRVICALAFGITVERLDDRLTLDCVHKVTAYFEVRFLGRAGPAVLDCQSAVGGSPFTGLQMQTGRAGGAGGVEGKEAR